MTRRAIFMVFLAVLAVAGPAIAAEPLHVLVVNDDGVDAPGLEALVRTFRPGGPCRVTVVAPAEQQSAMGHALVIRRSIEVREHPPIAGWTAWAVDATPATTARIALSTLLKSDPPDLVLSGINRGENVGTVIMYSGTVAAAREAASLGYPSIAFSLALEWGDPHPDWTAAARWTRPVVDAIARQGLPPDVFLNVNIPRDPRSAEGYRLARMSLAADVDSWYEVVREEGGSRWFRGHWKPSETAASDTDVAALEAGWVTLTPLGVDQTAYRAYPALEALAKLPVPDFPPSAGGDGKR